LLAFRRSAKQQRLVRGCIEYPTELQGKRRPWHYIPELLVVLNRDGKRQHTRRRVDADGDVQGRAMHNNVLRLGERRSEGGLPAAATVTFTAATATAAAAAAIARTIVHGIVDSAAAAVAAAAHAPAHRDGGGGGNPPHITQLVRLHAQVLADRILERSRRDAPRASPVVKQPVVPVAVPPPPGGR